MLGLRTDRGLPEAWLRTHCAADTLDALIEEGALVRIRDGNGTDTRLRVPENRFFVSDDIIRALV